MTLEEATKNHPGGETSKPLAERETRLCSTGAEMMRLPVSNCTCPS